MAGGQLIGNMSTVGGSVHIEGVDFEMQCGVIRNSSEENGGAVCVENGNFLVFIIFI